MKKAARPSARNSSAATARTILSGRRLAIAEQHNRRVGQQHAESGAGGDEDQRVEARGERHGGELRLVADLDQEEGNQGGHEGAGLTRRLRSLVGLVGDQAPAGHDDEGGAQDPAHRVGADPAGDRGADPGRECMIGERRQKHSQDDRDRLAIARRQHQREQLCLVADLGDGDDGGRDEKCFHRRAFAQKEQLG